MIYYYVLNATCNIEVMQQTLKVIWRELPLGGGGVGGLGSGSGAGAAAASPVVKCFINNKISTVNL